MGPIHRAKAEGHHQSITGGMRRRYAVVKGRHKSTASSRQPTKKLACMPGSHPAHLQIQPVKHCWRCSRLVIGRAAFNSPGGHQTQGSVVSGCMPASKAVRSRFESYDLCQIGRLPRRTQHAILTRTAHCALHIRGYTDEPPKR